jgi:hypothetical protein
MVSRSGSLPAQNVPCMHTVVKPWFHLPRICWQLDYSIAVGAVEVLTLISILTCMCIWS